MKALLLLNWRLLRRNRLIEVSIVVTAIYALILHAFADAPIAEKLLVLLIFNDPALLGLLFVGVMVLMERDERVLSALAVLPLRKWQFVWQRVGLLSTLATLAAGAMALSVRGLGGVHWGHFLAASVLTSVFFGLMGFVVVARSRSFNDYIMSAVGAILLLSVPFFGYFGLGEWWYYAALPTQAAVDAFNFAFTSYEASWAHFFYAYAYLLLCCVVAHYWAMRRFNF